MIPKAFIHHQLSSRLRLYVPSKKGDASFFENTQRELESSDLVDGVEISPQTGSILIYYHGDLSPISSFARLRDLFIMESQPTKKSHKIPSRKIFDRIKTLNGTIIKGSEGHLDLAFIIVCGLVGLALIQAKNGKFMPPAWTLISQALSAINFGGFADIVSDLSETD